MVPDPEPATDRAFRARRQAVGDAGEIEAADFISWSNVRARPVRPPARFMVLIPER